jgi:hypothetical protein
MQGRHGRILISLSKKHYINNTETPDLNVLQSALKNKEMYTQGTTNFCKKSSIYETSGDHFLNKPYSSKQQEQICLTFKRYTFTNVNACNKKLRISFYMFRKQGNFLYI